MIRRRRFLQAGLVLTATACAAEVSVSLPAPTSTPTLGPTPPIFSPTPIGGLEDVKARVEAQDYTYVPEAKAWLVEYPAQFVEAAKLVYPTAIHEGLDAGLLAMHEKCTHLGCRVPECTTSGQLECLCHGSMYSRWGEHRGGPAPRGLDLFPIAFDGDTVFIDQRGIVAGLDRGIDVTGSTPSGPNCVGPSEPETD